MLTGIIIQLHLTHKVLVHGQEGFDVVAQPKVITYTVIPALRDEKFFNMFKVSIRLGAITL